jgi:hypothetical protein
MNCFPGYDAETEERMQILHSILKEDDRRRYAAVEAMKIGYGGVAYISRLLRCAPMTIDAGITEIKMLQKCKPEDRQPPAGPNRTRRVGGGRHRKIDGEKGEALQLAFDEVLKPNTAGSPTDEEVKWTDLKPFQISLLLYNNKGIDASVYMVKQLLQDGGYRNRAPRKELITGSVDPVRRNEQFLYIFELEERYLDRGDPVLSIDTKKKEPIGCFRRPGKSWSREERKVYDHDFRHLAIGKGVPHGIYDVGENFGFINIGTSAETSQFIADSIARWYHWCGQYWYPDADEILLTFDSGGANGIHSKLFKEDMINLSARLGLKIRIAHYPPYTSKWNQIEHRLFSHLERSLGGLVLDSFELLRQAAANTMTATGLWAKAYILDKVYETGRECSAHFDDLLSLYFRRDERDGNWNYEIDARLLDIAE